MAPASSVRLAGSGTWVFGTEVESIKIGGDDATGLPFERDPGEDKVDMSPLGAGVSIPLPKLPPSKAAGTNSGGGKNIAIGRGLSGAGAVIAGRDVGGAAYRWAGSAGSGEVPRSARVESTQRLVATACGSFSQAARVPCQGRQPQIWWSNIIRRTGRTSRDWASRRGGLRRQGICIN
jgi:hypothetical protein